MVKCIWSIAFRTDISKDDAVRHWREIHAPLILALPGVVRYHQNVVLETVAPGWDGVAELYFETRALYEGAMASEQWAIIEVDGPKFIDMERLGAAIVDEIHILE